MSIFLSNLKGSPATKKGVTRSWILVVKIINNELAHFEMAITNSTIKWSQPITGFRIFVLHTSDKESTHFKMAILSGIMKWSVPSVVYSI